MVEDLDDLLPLDHLLNIAVHAAERALLALEAHAAARADRLDDQQHQREEGEGDEREYPVEVEHHRDRTHERHHVRKDARKAARDHLGDGVDVVCEAAHQVAGLVGVEIAQRQGLELVKQVLAERGDRLLGDAHHDARIGIRAQRRDAEHRAHQHEQAEKPLEVAGDDIVVDGGLEQVAGGDVAERAEHKADGHHHEQRLIPADIAHELFDGALQILRALEAVALRATAAAMTARRSLFSHRCSPLPAGTDRPHGRYGCSAAARRACRAR